MALIARYFYFDTDSNLHLYNIKPYIAKKQYNEFEEDENKDNNITNETNEEVSEIDYIKNASDDDIMAIYRTPPHERKDYSLKEQHEFNKRLVNAHKIDKISLKKSLEINDENTKVSEGIKNGDKNISNIVHDYIEKIPTEPPVYESPFLRDLKKKKSQKELSDIEKKIEDTIGSNNGVEEEVRDDIKENGMKELRNFGHHVLPKLDEFDNLFTYMIFKNDVQNLMQAVDSALESNSPGQTGDFEFLKIPDGILLIKERNIENSIPFVIHDNIAQEFIDVYSTKVEIEEG